MQDDTADDDKDGTPNKNDTTYNPPMQMSYAKNADTVRMSDNHGNGNQEQDFIQPPRK